MSRLVCVDHNSRVLVLPTRALHRADGSTCDSILRFGDKTFTVEQIRQFFHQRK